MNPQVWTFRTIDEDAFIERFRPRPNHLDPNASYDFGDGGCLFETYGPELDFVRAQDPRSIWTIVDDDNGQPVIESGMRFVNRLGFLVATNPVEDRVTYLVEWD